MGRELRERMPRILLVTNSDWFLYNYRLSLARSLQARGWEVVLVSPTGRYLPFIKDAGFMHITWDVGRKSTSIFQEMKAIRELLRIFRRERPDLVHLHTIKPVLYGSLAARFAGLRRTVRQITGRGYIFLGKETKARLLRPLVRLGYKLLLHGRTGRTIFENEADRQFFIQQKLVPASHAVLIEGVGVDTNHYTPLPEPPGVPVILLGARLLWDKGVGDLVNAARLLHQRLEVRVVLVGEPDEGNPASIPLETLANWQAEKVVELWGWQDDMRQVYARCHIVTLPSQGEGIPTALLEAAACSRPIVTTDVPGCRDVVQDGINGYLVSPGDIPSLAAALEKLVMDSGLRLRMGLAGRKAVEERFSDTSVNARTLEIYKSLLG